MLSSVAPVRIALLGAGNSVHLRQWAEQLARRGHQIDVLTLHPWEAAVPVGVDVHQLTGRGPAAYATAAREARRLVDELRPEVVHAHYATGYGYLGRRLGRGPLVISVYGSDVYDFPGRSSWRRRFLLANLDRAAVVCSTSHAMARRLVELGFAAERIRVVPFGVDTDRFDPGRRRPHDGLVVGTVKKLEPTYGIDVLLRAFAEVVAGAPDLGARLEVVGPGYQRPALERLAEQLGVADRVTFAGAVPHDEVPDRLGGFDVYVALSRQESFGLAAVEASAVGLPVVVSDAVGLAEVVRDGETGIVVPIDDPAAAGRAITRLLRDGDERARLGAAGRALAHAAYAWPTCVDRQVAAYAAVAGRWDRGRDA